MAFTFSGTARQLQTGARTHDWWASKLAPLLATAYATAARTGAPLGPLMPRLLGLLLALAVGAVYVSLLNEWTDRADDMAAGKPNRLAELSIAQAALALVLCLSAGLAAGWWCWHASPAAGLLYLAAWVVYSLYSLPPARLKVRGGWGLLADAAGAHLLPQLLAVVLVSHWVGVSISAGWLGAVGTWAMGCGLRNILAHQLGDAANDVRAGVGTFVVRWGLDAGRQLARAALLLEIAGFTMVLVLGWQPLPILALVLYGGLLGFRVRVWQQPVVVAQPQGYSSILILNEYYETYYPLALLLGQVLRYPADGWVLALHTLLFGLAHWQQVQLWGGALGIVRTKVVRLLHRAER